MSPPKCLAQTMAGHLRTRKSHSSYRQLSLPAPSSVDFSSNDFLSLSTSPELKSRYLTELRSSPGFWLGSGGSRLLDGNSAYAEDLEKEIAEFHGTESALLFNSGVDANSGFFATVPQRGDVVVYDERIHANVHEGMRLTRASRTVSFSHNSIDDLETMILSLLQGHDGSKFREGHKNVFVAIESLYSMDGDLADIEGVVETVERLLPGGNGYVVVDEAHSTGVYGNRGRGIACSLGLEDRVFARLHIFGKALACGGAVILSSKLTREYLINYARPLIYTTSMGFPTLAAVKVVYGLMREGATESLVVNLYQLIAHFYHELRTVLPLTQDPVLGTTLLAIPTEILQSPIIALLTPEPRNLARHCQNAGFVVRAIVPPTVPEGTQRVRVCLHARNTIREVESLVAMRQWLMVRRNCTAMGETGGELLKSAL